MTEKFENNISNKYRFKNKELYDKLVREYNLEENQNQLIFTTKNGNRHFFHKWEKMPKKGGGYFDLEEYIEKTIRENE